MKSGDIELAFPRIAQEERDCREKQMKKEQDKLKDLSDEKIILTALRYLVDANNVYKDVIGYAISGEIRRRLR